MRRALRKQAPALSHWFGIHPPDYERLTFGELRVYTEALASIARDQKKTAKPARKRR